MKIKMKTRLKTPLGIAEIWGDQAGVSRVTLVDEKNFSQEEVPDVLAPVVTQLKQYFQGDLTKFELKLNPSGTVFQKKVWRVLCDIPYGKTTSYYQLSEELGDIKAIRAVAAANGKNPLWIIVPCHRVIGSAGSLTGYAGGLWRKKWLLEHENPPIQQSLF